MDRLLPGLAPAHVTIRLDRQDDGYWEVFVCGAEKPGLVSRGDGETYVDLATYEAQDVVAAALEGLLGDRPPG